MVGAPDAASHALPSSGTVYVFERSPDGSWSETAQITPDDLEEGDWFGYDVAVSGDTIIVGATKASAGGLSSPGAAYVYERDGGSWRLARRLAEPDITGNLADYGWSVDVDADTIAVGARLATSPAHGRAFVYGRDRDGPGQWGRVAELQDDAWDSNASFGSSVALDGDLLVVGAENLDAVQGSFDNEGGAYVFGRDAGGPDAWGVLQRLHAGDAEPNDRFGHTVAIDGTTLLIGAQFRDSDLHYGVGRAYVFESPDGSAGSWTEVAALSGPDEPFAYLGRSLAIAGDLAVVGAKLGATSALGFERDHGGPGSWGVSTLVSPGDVPDESFSHSMAVGGGYLAVGAPDSRAIHVYEAPWSAPPDTDGDGIPDTDDICSAWPNAGQEDTDQNGIGDVCECGDQTGDGVVSILDILEMNQVIFGLVPAGELCDANDDGDCDVEDVLAANARLFGAPAHCERYPAPAP